MRKCLVCVSMMVLGLVAPANAAMSGSCRIEVEDSIVFPANEGERASYKAFIKTGRGEISGVCLLLHEGDTIKGAIVNEFGISALDFTYVMSADRMTLNHVIAMLDKWYVRAVIKEICGRCFSVSYRARTIMTTSDTILVIRLHQ